MSISTLDGLIASIARGRTVDVLKIGTTAESIGSMHSRFLATGRPGAGVAPSVGLNGEQVTSATVGALPFSYPTGGYSAYLAAANIAASVACSVSVYDRLWQNSGIDPAVTTEQAITPVAIPARDANGAAAGAGTFAALEVYTATTNAGAITTITISYTNQSGTAGRTGKIASFPATAVAGTVVEFDLQSGDTGVRSIESITLGTSLVTGAVGLVIGRKLAFLPCPAANVATNLGFDDIGVQMWPGSAVFLTILQSATTATTLTGTLTFAEG
jgi:hypothetical protein